MFLLAKQNISSKYMQTMLQKFNSPDNKTLELLQSTQHFPFQEAVTQICSAKKVFLKNLHESACVSVSFLIYKTLSVDASSFIWNC